MMTPNTIDFSKVEILRKHIGLSIDDVAVAMEVSRVSYYSWLRGGGMRKGTASRARKIIKILLDLYRDPVWQKEVRPQSPDVRRERWLALVG
jgi:transcriptional regulator with XRE-family HTH domain